MKEFKKVIIFGLGVSGRSALRLMALENVELILINKGPVEQTKALIKDDIELSSKSVTIIEDNDKDELLKHIDSDFLILSPGIPREHSLIIDLNIPIYSEIEVASWYIDSPIVAITGTNGKTTTVSFLDECLKHSKVSHFTGGNIGRGLCDYVVDVKNGADTRKELILLELSSFQLESMESFSPKISAILNLTFSHGERYSDLKSYAIAKSHILKNCDYAFVAKGIFESSSIECPYTYQGEEVDLADIDKVRDKLYSLDKNAIQERHIKGDHNLLNIYFAMLILEKLGIDLSCLIKALKTFKGAPFRFQKIFDENGLEVFNDAKSTNWQSTETALKAFKKDDVVTLIIGGQCRGENDYDSNFFKTYESDINLVILTGESGKLIHDKLLEEKFNMNKVYLHNLSDIKKYITENKIKGKLVYSPAFPSFDQFKNYIDRGESFNKLFI